MTNYNIEVTYFETGGTHNTEKALEIAKKYADQFDIKDIVMASTTGTTAEKSLQFFDPNECNLVVITHSYYFIGVNKRQEFPEEKMADLKNKGLKFFIGTHAFAGPERSMRMSLKQWGPIELLAKYLRTNFSQGMKVCMEIAIMAVDAGLIEDIEKDIICIGGTGRGADTVCLIKPAPTSVFDKLRVKMILCKP
ncbi:MAG: pyruvate kinase alpha/beta domain-containing protein, partial [Candidatus Thorarchaeota archaeon]